MRSSLKSYQSSPYENAEIKKTNNQSQNNEVAAVGDPGVNFSHSAASHSRRGEENGRDTDPKPALPALMRHILPSPHPSGGRRVVHPAVVAPDGGGGASSSGFLLLGEVEDLAVGLPQVLLLFEVHLKRPLDGHKGNTSLEEKNTKCVDRWFKDGFSSILQSVSTLKEELSFP